MGESTDWSPYKMEEMGHTQGESHVKTGKSTRQGAPRIACCHWSQMREAWHRAFLRAHKEPALLTP
jgi:hypothetical protein